MRLRRPLSAPTPTAPITMGEFAHRLVEIATGAADLMDRAEVTGDTGGMLAAIESRAEVTAMLATSLDIAPDIAESLVAEAEATARGLARLKLSGLPLDAETLAWFVRDAGGQLARLRGGDRHYPAMGRLSEDRNGASWLDLLDDHDAQIARFGRVRFARGHWSADLPKVEPGSPEEEIQKAQAWEEL